MSDPRDDIWEKRADRAYDSVTYHPWRTTLLVVGGLIGLALVIGVLGLVGGWFSGTAHLASFEHSQEQVTAVLQDWTSMQAAAENVCDVEKAGTKDDPSDPVIIENPAFAYRATYRKIEQDYNRRMGNLFEAYVTRHLPLPGSIQNLPQTAPTLNQAKDKWCL